MPAPTSYDAFAESSPENLQLLRRDEMRLKFAEALATAMDDQGVTIEDLAAKLKRVPQHVKQLLRGEVSNLNRYSAAFHALDVELTITPTRRTNMSSTS